jgi:hypothetical protein
MYAYLTKQLQAVLGTVNVTSFCRRENARSKENTRRELNIPV